MKILIIGGNRFFGKKLASKFLQEEHNVTLMNRGNTEDGLGQKIHRIRCDRTDTEQMKKNLEGFSWDVVYDQMCFDFHQAKAACELFKGKTKKYILTSTQSVYHSGLNLKESDFDPYNYSYEKAIPTDEDYGEAKRQAEAAFFKYAEFPVTALRIPIVIGEDDYTGRFSFHVDRIKQGLPMYFPNLEANISFISSDDAAKVLHFLGSLDFEGPINAASPKPIKLKSFLQILEDKAEKKAVLTDKNDESTHSSYGIKGDWCMDCSKLKELGLELPNIEDWLPGLVS